MSGDAPGRAAVRAWTAAVFAAVAAFCLAVAATDSHLSLDDWGYVYGCPFVKDGLSFANIKAAFATLGHGGIWMPLTYVSYMADISFFGAGWRAHHVVCSLLHAVNAAVAFRLLLMLLVRIVPGTRRAASGMTAIAAAAALAWALCPARAESYAWVASRKEELWALFAMCGVAACIRFAEGRSLRFFAAALALFAASCLSKPTAMCFPLLALAAERLAARKDPDAAGKANLPILKFYFPLFAVSAAVALIAWMSQTSPDGMAKIEVFDQPIGWRLVNAAVSLGLYVSHAVAPFGLHADYRYVAGDFPLETLKGIAFLAAAAGALAFALRGGTDAARRETRRVALLSALWFAVPLLPVLGVFGTVGDTAYADRYSYLPDIGIALAWAYALSRIPRPALCLSLAAAVPAAFAAASVPVARSYANDVASCERALAHDPDNWRSMRTLGREIAARQGRKDEGIRMLKRSFHLHPSRLTAEILAYLLAHRGAKGDFDLVKRIGSYAIAKPALDDGGMMLDALGVVALREGDDRSAAKLFAASLVAPRRSYQNNYTMLNLGLAFANCGNRPDAVTMLMRLRSVRDEKIRARAEAALEHIKNKTPGRIPWEP